jgi:hypothetical protein
MATIAHHHTNREQRVRIASWEIQPWKPVVAGLTLLTAPVAFLMIVIGGILFWVPHMPLIAHGHTDMTQLEVAQNGIGTMKKMVGNNGAWAEAIKQEYERVYGADSTKAYAACGNATTSFNSAK